MFAAADDIQAFLQAAFNGDVDAVQRGIELGLVNNIGNGPEDGPEERRGGWSALHWAIRGLRAEMVHLLLAARANTESKTEGKRHTPLSLALAAGHAEILKMLLAAGADVEIGPWGATAMHWAATNGSLEMAQTLIEARVCIDAPDAYRRTPLHEAADKKQPEIVELLLAAGADIEAKEKISGRRPLHHAVPSSTSERDVVRKIVKMLLAAGCDPRAIDDEGRTARDLAIRYRDKELAALLEGVEQECSQSFILNMKVLGIEELTGGGASIYANGRPTWMRPRPVAKIELTLTTLGGRTAATLTWPDERRVQEFPSVVRAAVRSSGFEAPLHSEWKIVLPNGALLDPRKGVRLSEQVPC